MLARRSYTRATRQKAVNKSVALIQKRVPLQAREVPIIRDLRTILKLPITKIALAVKRDRTSIYAALSKAWSPESLITGAAIFAKRPSDRSWWPQVDKRRIVAASPNGQHTVNIRSTHGQHTVNTTVNTTPKCSKTYSFSYIFRNSSPFAFTASLSPLL